MIKYVFKYILIAICVLGPFSYLHSQQIQELRKFF